MPLGSTVPGDVMAGDVVVVGDAMPGRFGAPGVVGVEVMPPCAEAPPVAIEPAMRVMSATWRIARRITLLQSPTHGT
jgi:hypothetical protein